MKKYYYDPTKYKTYLEQLGIKYPTVRSRPRFDAKGADPCVACGQGLSTMGRPTNGSNRSLVRSGHELRRRDEAVEVPADDFLDHDVRMFLLDDVRRRNRSATDRRRG